MNTYSILDYYDGENSELFKSSVMVVMEELVVSYRTAFHWEPFQVLGNLGNVVVLEKFPKQQQKNSTVRGSHVTPATSHKASH